MINSTEKFLLLVDILKTTEIEFQDFKVIQLSQAILESGWGTSDLFLKFNNPFGLKFRREMKYLADSVSYKNDSYCHFCCLLSAVKGYWRFIERPVYSGFRECSNSLEFLDHIVNAGYAGSSEKIQADYINKIQKIIPKALELL